MTAVVAVKLISISPNGVTGKTIFREAFAPDLGLQWSPLIHQVVGCRNVGTSVPLLVRLLPQRHRDTEKRGRKTIDTK